MENRIGVQKKEGAFSGLCCSLVHLGASSRRANDRLAAIRSSDFESLISAPSVGDDDLFLSRLYGYTIERSAQMGLFIERGDDVGYLHESVTWKVSKARVVKLFRELETHRADRKTEPLE